MFDPPFDAEAYVDAAARLVGLPLDPAHRPGVVLNFGRIAQSRSPPTPMARSECRRRLAAFSG